MSRLLAGRPQRTDGWLVKDNLWKEAGLSRATMNRAGLVMAEWDGRVAGCGGGLGSFLGDAMGQLAATGKVNWCSAGEAGAFGFAVGALFALL